jgi:hypothetical protein
MGPCRAGHWGGPMIDYSVYPDLDHPPDELLTPEDKADYVARVCGAWDFDLPPTPETFSLFSSWRDVFDRFPLPHSPAYAAFRTIFRWPPLPGGSVLEADYERVDKRAGRQLPDPCVHEV